MVRIRKAQKSDEANVRTLLKALLVDLLIDGEPVDVAPSAGSTFRALISGERGSVLVAEDESGFLGCISFSYNLAIRYGGEYAQIEELIVNENARGSVLVHCWCRLLLMRLAKEAVRKLVSMPKTLQYLFMRS